LTKHTHHEIGDHAACIRLVPIFNHLEDSAMNYIAEKAHTKQYQKGEFLFRSQEKEDTLYIINRGKIRIYRLADSGKEQLVRISPENGPCSTRMQYTRNMPKQPEIPLSV